MISEKQDGLIIFNWLSQWLNSGIKQPNEAVCDFSFALLGAMSRAFCNGISLRLYLEKCFYILQGKKQKLPQCYLRIDVAHMIKIFCHLKCLIGIKNKRLKQFYVRGFRLLLTSSHFEEFKKILTSLLTIMLSETDGSSNNTNETPAESSSEYILNLIKGIKVDGKSANDDDTFDDDGDDEDNDNDHPQNSTTEIDTEIEITSNEISEFLKEVEFTSRNNASIQGNRILAFYLSNLIKDIIRLCKYFPLWT